jgi:hypothetical protein
MQASSVASPSHAAAQKQGDQRAEPEGGRDGWIGMIMNRAIGGPGAFQGPLLQPGQGSLSRIQGLNQALPCGGNFVVSDLCGRFNQSP